MVIVVTGAAGFIGSQICEYLLENGHQVRGVDCFTDYYARPLKEMNLKICRDHDNFQFWEEDLVGCDLERLLDGTGAVIHLAAQAGVRKSWGSNFQVYTHNNLTSTQMLLETLKAKGEGRMVYASSSSVYGDTDDLPMRVGGHCRPVSPYGVTKLAAEHMCSLYTKNFGLDTVSLRYFTVYGPRQRPDMAFHRFIRALLEDGEIRLFGDGEQSRDFTYVADIVDATVKAALLPQAGGQIFNVGGGHRVTVNHVIRLLEQITGKTARVNRLEVAKGDVRNTEADCSLTRELLGYEPGYDLEKGLAAEVDWIKEVLPVLKEV